MKGDCVPLKGLFLIRDLNVVDHKKIYMKSILFYRIGRMKWKFRLFSTTS